MTLTAILVVVAALALGGLVVAFLVARRAFKRLRAFEAELDRGRAVFDEVIGREIDTRAAELERTLARARADSVSQLVDEERRIAEEYRREFAERESAAGATLSQRLTEAQQRLEQRLASWAADLERAQQGLSRQIVQVGERQRQQLADLEARIGADAEGLQTASDEQRVFVARLREDLERVAGEIVAAAGNELDQHAAERRRALHEVAERLRRRERDLKETIEREQTEAVARVQSALGDVERRQVEQLERVVARAATRYSESATQQFDTAIRSAREEAARRLGRELDLSVERFAREAEGVLAERMNQVGEAGAKRIERRLATLAAGVERAREEAIEALEKRAAEEEEAVRDRMSAIAADAEAERGVLEARLHELSRRIEEALVRAQERIEAIDALRR